MRKFGAALAISALLVTSACGGGGGSRPSESELSKALQKGSEGSVLGNGAGKVSKKAADCVAKVLVDSRISDKALKAIVDGDKTYQPSKADTSAGVAVSSKIVKCISSGIGN